MFAILIIGLIAGPAVSLYGSPTVSPVTAALWAMFAGGVVPSCLETADVDNGGAVNVSDAITLLAYLFAGGEPPALPGPPGVPCGPDPQHPGSLDLGCDEYSACGAS